MTRREEWLRIVAAMLSAGKNGDYARLTADEMIAEADERWPSESMTWQAAWREAMPEHAKREALTNPDAKEGE